MLPRVVRSTFLFAIVLVASACKSEPEEEPGPVGVNDVRKACEIRTTWTQRGATLCAECLAYSKSPSCDCPSIQRDFSARCHSHHAAKQSEPTCDGVDACVYNCPPGDCACAEGCYANKEACRPLGNATDGCIAEVCSPYCR